MASGNKIAGPIIDSDAHVVETEQTWSYMTGADARFKPKLFSSPSEPGREYWIIDGKIRGNRFPSLTEKQQEEMSKKAHRQITTPTAAREMNDIGLRLKHMDELGVDVQVLHNTLWINEVTDRPDYDVALATSWIRWMSDIWKEGKGRLRWTTVLPYMDIPSAIALMGQAQDNGAVGVVIRPYEGTRFMLDPYFYPIFAEAERRGMPMIVHVANANDTLREMMGSRFDLGRGFTTFRLPTVTGCHALFLSEVPKKFPKLKWGFIEVSAQWVPWIIHEAWRRGTAMGMDVPKNPLEAFNTWVSAQTDDDFDYIFSYCGDDRILIGTDYGHSDTSSEVDAIETFRNMANVTDAAKHKVLSKNPAEFYGL